MQQIIIILPFVIALFIYAFSWKATDQTTVDDTYYAALLFQLGGIIHLYILSRGSAPTKTIIQE